VIEVIEKIGWGKNKMKLKKITCRDFLEKSLKVEAGAAAGSIALEKLARCLG